MILSVFLERMSSLKVLISALVLFIQLVVVKDAQSQSFLYHRPESDFLDTCVFQCIQGAKVITRTYVSKHVQYTDTLSNVNAERDLV